MKKEEIKQQVSIKALFASYGHREDPQGRVRCLFPEQHKNGDANPSVTFCNDTATCHSQKCFAGADIFTVVKLMEGLDTFPEQKD